MTDLEYLLESKQFEFPKECRLLTSEEYNFVFSNPYKVANNYFLILARENNLEYSRLGLIVAKKNVRKANKRNRIKRIVRESFRCNKNTLKNLDIIFLARRDIGILTNIELRERLDSKWKRLSLSYKTH